MRKGFTLVELLAVIVLLGLVSIVAFPNIIEVLLNTSGQLQSSKLRLVYQATERYLSKERNAYPSLEGNSFCIPTTELQEEDSIDFEDLPENWEENVVHVRVGKNGKLTYDWVERNSCEENGVIAANLGSVKCEIFTSGYAYEKEVQVQYPTGTGYHYSYSIDNGETWIKHKDVDENGVGYITFDSNGFLLARVQKDGERGARTCGISVSQVDKTQIGSIVAYTGDEIPKGYFLADGREISRKAYNKLYQAIGTRYGIGDGADTFNIPNVQGKVIVGMNAAESEFQLLGQTGGEKVHTITTAELASHTHTFTGTSHTHTFTGSSSTTSSDGEHTHTTPKYDGSTNTTGNHTHIVSRRTGSYRSGIQSGWRSITAPASANGDYSQDSSTENAGNHSHTVTTTATNTQAGGSHTHTVTLTGTVSKSAAQGSNANTGGGGAHNNLMPYHAIKYIIKYQ